MVRLKESIRFVCMKFIDKFQFHYGSVKRLRFEFDALETTAFQFHYGSVKS